MVAVAEAVVLIALLVVPLLGVATCKAALVCCRRGAARSNRRVLEEEGEEEKREEWEDSIEVKVCQAERMYIAYIISKRRRRRRMNE